MKKAAEFLKEQQNREMMKKSAEIIKEASNRVSNSKWEKKFREYNYKFQDNIIVMVGGLGLSLYCSYNYWFKNVGEEVKLLNMTVNRMDMTVKEVESDAVESKKRAVELEEKVNKLTVEVAALKKAHHQAPRSFSSRLMTMTPIPIPPEHAAALLEMRQHQLQMQAWRKKWMI